MSIIMETILKDEKLEEVKKIIERIKSASPKTDGFKGNGFSFTLNEKKLQLVINGACSDISFLISLFKRISINFSVLRDCQTKENAYPYYVIDDDVVFFLPDSEYIELGRSEKGNLKGYSSKDVISYFYSFESQNVKEASSNLLNQVMQRNRTNKRSLLVKELFD